MTKGRRRRVPASLLALGDVEGIAFAACSPLGATAAPTDAMMEHTPAPS